MKDPLLVNTVKASVEHKSLANSKTTKNKEY